MRVTFMQRSALVAILLLAFVCGLSAQPGANRKGSLKPLTLVKSTPEEAGLSSANLLRADEVINEAIAEKSIPGAVLAVVRGNKLAYLKAYGNKQVYPDTVKMTPNTIFDMASCSKSMGTAIAMMQLLERGYYRLTDPVKMYIEGFEPYVDPQTGKKVDIRMVDLLTHSSGLPPYVAPDIIKKQYGNDKPESLLDWISHCKRDFRPTTDFQYSCLNFITLAYILEKMTGMTLTEYAQKNIFDVMGMKNTSYSPKAQGKSEMMKLIAPTEKQADGSVLLGEVHDPLARVINKGNSGNAGVFSNAEDIAILVAALMNGGEINGARVLGKATIERMSSVPKETAKLGRSLGWDNYSPYASNNGNILHPTKTYGHTGYTGTSIVIDPVNKISAILLTNRVHPEDKGGVVRLRALVANVVAGSIVR